MPDVVRSFRIPEDVWMAIQAEADGRGSTPNEVVLACVRYTCGLEPDPVVELLDEVRAFAGRLADAGRTAELTRLVFLELRDNEELARLYRRAVQAVPGRAEGNRRASVNRRIGRALNTYFQQKGGTRVRTRGGDELVGSFTSLQPRT